MPSLTGIKRQLADLKRRIPPRMDIRSIIEGEPEPVCAACAKGSCKQVHVLIVKMPPWPEAPAALPAPEGQGFERALPPASDSAVSALPANPPAPMPPAPPPPPPMPEPQPEAPRAPAPVYCAVDAPAAQQTLELQRVPRVVYMPRFGFVMPDAEGKL